jgi:hypothetical protein
MIGSYNARFVKIYNAMSSLVRFEMKKKICIENNALANYGVSAVVVHSEVVGLAPGSNFFRKSDISWNPAVAAFSALQPSK